MNDIKILLDVFNSGLRLRNTAPVDDDFGEMMHNFDSALKAADTMLNDKGVKIFEDIAEELKSAREKFPNNAHVMNALTEEVGELAQALLQVNYEPEKKTNADVYKEAIQVATMAIRVATEGDSTLPAYVPVSQHTEESK